MNSWVVARTRIRYTKRIALCCIRCMCIRIDKIVNGFKRKDKRRWENPDFKIEKALNVIESLNLHNACISYTLICVWVSRYLLQPRKKHPHSHPAPYQCIPEEIPSPAHIRIICLPSLNTMHCHHFQIVVSFGRREDEVSKFLSSNKLSFESYCFCHLWYFFRFLSSCSSLPRRTQYAIPWGVWK